jgi:RimJ/RimL family protein N-acetyltransferase
MKILETDRLVLRTFQTTDIDPMTLIDQDPKVCQYLPAIGTRTSTEAGVQRIIQHYEERGFSLYAVELKKSCEFIGFLGLITPSFQAHFTPAVEIGWRLASKHWNKGYATEGAKAVLHYGFTQLNLNKIVSFTVVNNHASRRVMEKIGLHHNQQDDFNHPRLSIDNPLCRHVLYQLSKTEYSRREQNQQTSGGQESNIHT